MDIHLYMLCYRYEALVASHLSPEEFGLYMAIGTAKLARGNVVFFEIDRSLSDGYFRLHDIHERCKPHADGAPKRSKYISIYRVMEHIPLNLFGKLYLTTADGRTMALDSENYSDPAGSRGANLYDELCPVTPMVVSSLSPGAFTSFMTDRNNPLHVPRIFFADMLLDRDESGELAGYLPYQNPEHILSCIKELESDPSKPTKTISRHGRVHGFFRTIRRGFYLGDQSGVKFYRYPSLDELQVKHSRWWRSASESLVS